MTSHQTSLTSPQDHPVTDKTHIRFPGLNTLRFYAATAVIVEHAGEQFPPNRDPSRIITLFFINSQNAVNLFFVLSGFLITYLLLNERATKGTINIGNFYLRRLLRIWPLYYFVASLGLIIFPMLFGSNYPLTSLPGYDLVLAFVLLPNFANLGAPMIHLWSIGLEEQFYASWPWAARTDSAMLRACFGIILLKLLLTPVITFFNNNNMASLFYGLRFECMAIGALGAYVYARKLPCLKWIYQPCTQLLTLALFVYLTIIDIPLNTYDNLWSSLVFILLIMNVATNPQSLLKLDFPFFEKLGEISYGLYLYHFPVLYLIIIGAHNIGLGNFLNYPFVLLVSAFVINCIVAALSYRWFETPFLNLKKKFSVG